MNLKKYAATIMVSSLLLTGCSGGSSDIKQKDGKDIVASLTDTNIYADDIFNQLTRKTGGKNAYFDVVLKELIDKHFPVDDAMKTDADMMVENVESYYRSQYGDLATEQLEMALSQDGFKDIEDYRTSLITRQQTLKFLDAYVVKNYDAIFEDYYTYATPRIVSMIKISMADIENPTEEENSKLQEATTLIQAGEDFNSVAKNFSDDETSKKAKGNLGVVDTTTDFSSYGTDIGDVVLSLGADEMTEALKGTDGYYIFKCTSTSTEDIKNEIQYLGTSSPLLFYDNYLVYTVFTSYNLTYKDDNVQTIITNIVEKALQDREEARGGTE